jgi:hypothetical protein
MPREVINAIGLAFSMLGGVILSSFCCINPLDHTPSAAPRAAVTIIVGAICGALAWTARGWLRARK